MKVILKKTHGNLGKAGEIVNVKDGYYRNFLQPNSIAIPYTRSAAKQIEMLKARAQKFADEKKEQFLYLKSQLEKQNIVFHRKTAESGKLFGSITNIDIYKELTDRGFELEKKAIKLDDHIKLIGEYKIQIELAKDVIAEIMVEIKEEAEEAEEAEETEE